ncbi:unnamed protein product [Clonostachys byssicola]|uniref:Uncharacterized protein n=1 Tax=Clonostachys byssicola TaxID=160290 RepID=A0A9N9USD6_9HYPO|nr:unnamed protein product [Clonostachys byssicola]
MRFNIAFLCAFLGAGTQLVAGTQPAAAAQPAAAGQTTTAKPKLKWNRPEVQGVAMFVGATCTWGSAICDANGKPVTKIVASVTYCCAVAASAQVASRGPHWEKAAQSLGPKAKLVYDASRKTLTNGGRLMAACPGGLCRMVQMSKVTGAVVNGAVKGVNNVKVGWAGVKKKTKQAAVKVKQQLHKLPRPGRKKQPTSSGAILPLTNSPRPRPRSINGFPKRRNNQRKQRRSNYRKMKRSSSPSMQIRSRKPTNINNYY